MLRITEAKLLVIQESCTKKPISDVEQKTELIFISRPSQFREASEKFKDIHEQLNCDAPVGDRG